MRHSAKARPRPQPSINSIAAISIAALVLTGCDGNGRLKVRVEHESLGSMADVEVLAVPFDANALLDSLADAATTPKPEFASLWERLQTYERRDLAAESTFVGEWQAARLSVKALSDSLLEAGRDAPGYDRDYIRFRQLYRSLTTREAALQAEIDNLTADDKALADSAAAAATTLRQWEASAFADFDRLAAEAATQTGRQPIALTTDEAGVAETELPAGEWWIVARTSHPKNPFVELLWHVPARVGSWFPVTTPLDGGNVTLSLRR